MFPGTQSPDAACSSSSLCAVGAGCKCQLLLEARSHLPPTARPARLRPRDGLPEAVRAVFRELVARATADHFAPADEHLVERYACAVALAREASEALQREGAVIGGARGPRVNPWVAVAEKADRSVATLAVRLRLGPQSRVDPKTAGRRASGPGRSAYELMEMEDET